jgi:hypothetical protein
MHCVAFLRQWVIMMAGGAGGGFEVDYRLLAEAAEGINGVISQLSDLGIAETGEEGRGFALLDMDAEGLGVPSLMSAFSGFTGRWSWGVRTLVQDGNQFAQRLGGQIFSAWKPAMTLSPQERREMDQINSSEIQDIKGGPWWLQAARTADKNVG